MEHDCRGTGGFRGRSGPKIGQGRWPPGQSGAAFGRNGKCRARRYRFCRAGSGHRGWFRQGISPSGRRRSGHWQIHPAAAIGGGAGSEGQTRYLCVRRGSGCPGEAAGATIGPGRSWCAAGCRNQCRDHSRHARKRAAAGPGHHRFHPDPMDRPRRFRTGHRHPGAHLGPGANSFCQEERRCRGAGRSRHQGRANRRTARGRAHGRCRAVFRGRQQSYLPHPSRGEEPLRRHRRDRRLRHDRARARTGGKPFRPVP